MVSDEDTFDEEYEEEEYEETFPDAEEDEYEEPVRTYEQPRVDRWKEFLADPYPKVTFILSIIGIAVVVLMPPDISYYWKWTLVGLYFLMVIVGAGSVMAIKAWKMAEGRMIRYGGLTNLFVMYGSIIIALADIIVQIATGNSIVPGFSGSLVGIAGIIILFSVYSLWLIQRVVTSEGR
ncbi:MAG: conserved membrane protein of unknown function [Candidatus Thorarchaeota archaeon]|nr:MAG: conserved membrane protein of unknown function [Candidatus Thorarchaeota archaeon]